MARPAKQAEPIPSETLRALAVVRKGDGWVLRTYLFDANAALTEDSDVDTFGAAVGRATRELAKEGR